MGMRMNKTSKLTILILCVALSADGLQAEDVSVARVPGSENQWPMSGGPDGSWQVKTDLPITTEWSVRSGKNIKWKTSLPAGGQSGIAVWNDRLFLTINPPTAVNSGGAPSANGASSADIVLCCLDAITGEMLWQQTVKGLMPSDYDYGFSDSTTPCPITDGNHVWALNSSGGMACFTIEGDRRWERTWMPTNGRPFNKQFDSILYGDLILSVEPPEKNDSARKPEWNYLHAFDKSTGERRWITSEAITHYNAPVLGVTATGEPAVLIARGGPHGVPERPVGLSMIRLNGDEAGKALWSWEPEAENKVAGWGALSTQHWNPKFATWFYKSEYHLTVDTQTGKLISKHKLNQVDQYNFDPSSNSYTLKPDVALDKFDHQRHCNILANDKVFFMVRHQPYLARHDTMTGKNEHFQVPRELADDGSYIWKAKQSNDGLNARGQRHGRDKRTLGGGFQKCFLGSPTMINNYIFFTNAIGMVYVVDASSETFDGKALVAVNDLGERGQTWTVNSLSFANGHIYHRTLKEVICIGD